MANPLPILRNTTGTLNAQVLYPFTRTVTFLTGVTTFMNGSEQRWAERPPLYGFNLPMNSLLSADKASWLSFFVTQKGRFNQDLTVSLGATTYSNLTLIDDALTAANQRPLQYDQSVGLRQVSNGAWTAPTAGTTYPTLSTGSVAMMPFAQSSNFLTTLNDNADGPVFSRAWYGASLSNFPTTYLRSWTLQYPLLSAADLATLETFFLNAQGRLASFAFVDPLDNTSYTHVRFDQDVFSVKYLTTTQFSTQLTLKQTFNS